MLKRISLVLLEIHIIAWVSELENQSGRKIGIELGTPSVTSPGITDVLNLDENKLLIAL